MLDKQNDDRGIPDATPPVVFKFENHSVRTIKEDDEIWFVAVDVCEVLDIANPRDALSRLDEDEKGVVITDTLGGPQEMNIVNESGLYNLTFSSRKPEAKRFKRWVTHEVLPAIRKTGRYEAGHGGAAPAIETFEKEIRLPRLEAGRYALTVLDNQKHYIYRLRVNAILTENHPLNITLLSLSLRTIGVLWRQAQCFFSLDEGDDDYGVLSELDETIVRKAGIATRLLAFYDRDPDDAAGPVNPGPNSPTPQIEVAGNEVRLSNLEFGRYILTFSTDNQYAIEHVSLDTLLDEATRINVTLLSLALKTIEALWRKGQASFSLDHDPEHAIALRDLDAAIIHGRNLANRLLSRYDQLGQDEV